jgi:hypothetical protein
MEKKEREEKLREITTSERVGFLYAVGNDDLLIEELDKFIQQELDKAREEGFNDGVEKAVGIIQKELDELLLQKDGENYWVGDILRDCGYTVEKILPKNMKGYLVKLKTKEDGK